MEGYTQSRPRHSAQGLRPPTTQSQHRQQYNQPTQEYREYVQPEYVDSNNGVGNDVEFGNINGNNNNEGEDYGGIIEGRSGSRSNAQGGSFVKSQRREEQQEQWWHQQYISRMGQQELSQIQTWFTNMDRDGNGQVTSNELACVAIGGEAIGMETSLKLIRIFDVDRNGGIEFYEYAALHKFLINMQGLFALSDTKGTGRLQLEQVSEAVAGGGFIVGDSALSSLYTKYNKSGLGLLITEFLALIAHVAQARSVFGWRDIQKQGVIQINCDQLIQITSEF